MVDASQIREHLEVVGSDGEHVGRVDHVAGDQIELAKLDLAKRRLKEYQDLVAAGAGTLTKEQREWCVGEAMVVTGFQFTPVELIEKGDAAMARLILDARKGG